MLLFINLVTLVFSLIFSINHDTNNKLYINDGFTEPLNLYYSNEFLNYMNKIIYLSLKKCFNIIIIIFMTLKSINPATGEVIREYAELGLEELEQKLKDKETKGKTNSTTNAFKIVPKVAERVEEARWLVARFTH